MHPYFLRCLFPFSIFSSSFFKIKEEFKRKGYGSFHWGILYQRSSTEDNGLTVRQPFRDLIANSVMRGMMKPSNSGGWEGYYQLDFDVTWVYKLLGSTEYRMIVWRHWRCRLDELFDCYVGDSINQEGQKVREKLDITRPLLALVRCLRHHIMRPLLSFVHCFRHHASLTSTCTVLEI